MQSDKIVPDEKQHRINLPPLPQEYYDENREKYDAETTEAPTNTTGCQHYLYRVSAIDVDCKHCSNRWRDLGEWKLKDGKVLTKQ